MFRGGLRSLICLIALGLCLRVSAETFRVATFNVENYLDEPGGTRPVKSDAAKAKVRESILAMKPDVIAFEEMGQTNAFFALQNALKTNGLDLPYWEYIRGWDTNIHVAILSRLPITARHPHTNDSYLLNGQRFFVSRGFAEVEIAVNPHYSFTLLAAHLKSKRQIYEADQADMRLEEAQILREKIDACLARNPAANLVVLGDFNDLRNSLPIRTIIGKGKTALVDTRPAERNGDEEHSERRLKHRTVTWTHFFDVEDAYERLDYILLSKGMAKKWDATGTYILALPNWGVASDHRPLVVSLEVGE